MKKLILNFVFPLTVMLFFLFSRSVCAEIVDVPVSTLQGFPLPYTCPNWGSSMSTQFFVGEFIIDVLVYFILLFSLCCLIDRFLIRIKPYKAVSITLYIIAGVFLFLEILIYSRDNTFYVHREFDIKVIRSGLSFWGWPYHGCP